MPNTYARILTHNDTQYYLQPDRNKLLSIPRLYIRAGTHRRTVTNEYLRLEDGQPAMTVGDSLIRDATIVGASINCEYTSSWVLKVYKRGNLIPLFSLPMVSDTKANIDSLDEDLVAGSVLLFKVEGSNIPFPRAMLEIAWRL